MGVRGSIIRSVLMATLALTLVGDPRAWDDARARSPVLPPGQSAAGPGGAQRDFPSVVNRRIGESPTGGWLFLPAAGDGKVASGPLPLTIFFHGYTATEPGSYLGWINHIARGGSAVFFPDYQGTDFAAQETADYLPNAIDGVRSLLSTVGSGDVPAIDQDRVRVVGHSLGGVLATGYAAIAAGEGLPVPGVMMPVQPGGCSGCGATGDRLGAPFFDLAGIDPETLALVVVGDDDTVVGSVAARRIWEGLGQIAADRRDLIFFRTDPHGDPELVADHLLPQTAGRFGEPDAYDYLGVWKLFDALVTCAESGIDCDVGLGGGKAQTSLGSWSDGTPVTPLIVSDDPEDVLTVAER